MGGCSLVGVSDVGCLVNGVVRMGVIELSGRDK